MAGIAMQREVMTETVHALSFPAEHDAESGRSGSNDLTFSGALLSAGTVAALIMSGPQAPAAEPVSPLAQGLLGVPSRDEAPPAQHFATPDGATRFTLDRSGQVALMRFDGRPEVIALTPTPGPRGDEYLKSDTGRVMLRVSPVGSVTVYGGVSSDGLLASASGRAAQISMPALPSGGLTMKMAEVERGTGRAVGHPVSFETPAGGMLTSAAAVGLVADAAERAAEGLAATKPANVSRVIIQFGARPEARLEGASLRVTITPQLGYAGRPSAEAVKTALKGSAR